MNALMYHDVVPAGAEDTSGFPGRDAALYKVTPGQFDAHLEAIQKSGGAASQASSSPSTTAASAMTAADVLERRGLRGDFFVTANYIGRPGFLTRTARAPRGHVVGSHSCSHPLRMAHCDWSQLTTEWSRSRAVLMDILGVPVHEASVPGGDYKRVVAEAAALASFATLFTSEPARTEKAIGGIVCSRPIHDPVMDVCSDSSWARGGAMGAVRTATGHVERQEGGEARGGEQLSSAAAMANPAGPSRGVGEIEAEIAGVRPADHDHVAGEGTYRPGTVSSAQRSTISSREAPL